MLLRLITASRVLTGHPLPFAHTATGGYGRLDAVPALAEVQTDCVRPFGEFCKAA